jgi:membrane protein DedA with SNARE-associated domain
MSDWITNLIEQMGYLGVALLMFLENVFPPIPSELVMPLAGYTSATGQMSLVGVILAGSAGSLAGALMWYYVGRMVGEEKLEHWAGRHGRWLTLTPDDIDKVDRRFERHGAWMVLVGRLIPAVRTLISIPAGIFCMRLPKFLLLSTIGTVLWTAALAYAGELLGDQYETVQRYVGPVSWVVIGVMLAWYLYRIATFKAQKG